jgi:Protein of unknown function (DUF664)
MPSIVTRCAAARQRAFNQLLFVGRGADDGRYGVPSLDITADDALNQHGSGGGAMSLREALVGMIEEYARHMGHADLLRERIDGRLGQ